MLAPSPANALTKEQGNLRQRLGCKIAASAPTFAEAAFGSALWAAAIAGSAGFELWLAGWKSTDQAVFLVGFFAAGAFLAFAPAIWIGRLLSRGRVDAGFAATLLALMVLTIGLTAFFYAMQYRLYYAMWHDHDLTVRFVFQFVFTTLSAIYQFLVLGLRLLLPTGFLALIAAAWWNATRLR